MLYAPVVTQRIKSIQRGRTSISGSTNVTISAVVLSKTTVTFLGQSEIGIPTIDPSQQSSSARLTTTTNLLIFTSQPGPGFYTSWEIVEYE